MATEEQLVLTEFPLGPPAWMKWTFLPSGEWMPGDSLMPPTSLQNPKMARQQRLIDQTLHEREWVPLWLAGPLVALVAIAGLIGVVMMLAELYAWLGKLVS